jgi:1-acyl-sn-glycerol-3-phosphate acyltransferase
MPAPTQGQILRWLHGAGGPPWGTQLSDFDPAAVKKTLDTIGLLFGEGRYFELDARGLENMPPSPSLVVSNHSGGTSIPDAWGFMASWYRHFGVGRAIHPMVHEMILSNRVTGEYFARRGALRAGRDMALAALRDWRRDVLVMPGGDLDTWRPYKKRYEVCFGGRTGYAWLALKAGVPIVPVANSGAHETLFVLTTGVSFAKAIRLQQLARASVFPISLSLPWGLTIGPLPHLPPPATLRYRFGPPIPPPVALAPDEEPSPEMVRALDAEVRRAVQRLLDGLKQEEQERKPSRARLGLARLASVLP